MRFSHVGLLILCLFSVVTMAQENTWRVEYLLDGEWREESVSLLSLESDYLHLSAAGERLIVPLTVLQKISRNNNDLSRLKYTLTGAAIGGGIGYMASRINEATDHGLNQREEDKVGVWVFVSIGTAVGAMTGLVITPGRETYGLSRMNIEARRRTLQSLIARNMDHPNGVGSSPDSESSIPPTGFKDDEPATRVLLFGGVGIPVGDFGSTTSIQGGGAKTGFAVGAEVVWEFNPTMAITFAGIFTLNGVNTDRIPAETEAGVWTNAWITPGLRLGTKLPSGARLFLAGYCGFLLGSTPSVSTSSNQGLKSSTEGAFAYGTGAGAIILDRLSFGVRYLRAEPDYKLEYLTMGSFLTVTYPQPTSILLGYIGYYF